MKDNKLIKVIEYIKYLINKNFHGNIEIHFCKGGITKVKRYEEIEL